MDHDTVLKNFKEAIEILSKNCEERSIVRVDLGYLLPRSGARRSFFFCDRLGKDFFEKVSARFAGNVKTHRDHLPPRSNSGRERSSDAERRTFLFKYSCTPFFLSCKISQTDEEDEVAQKDDVSCWYDCGYGTYVVLDDKSESVKIKCYTFSNKGVSASSFFLVHRCLLMVRDITNMVETVDDSVCSILPVSSDDVDLVGQCS